MLVIAGDFNCCTGTVPLHVGSSTYTWRNKQQTGAIHQDRGSFADLLRRHGLIALNSWGFISGTDLCEGIVAFTN